MYKMICIDIDGTLIRSDLTLAKETVEAVRKAKERGVLVVLATGRMHRSAAIFAEKLCIEDPIISSNGALVKDPGTDEVFYREYLGKEDVEYIIRALDRFGVHINFYNEDTMYVTEIRDYVHRYERMKASLPEHLRITVQYEGKDFHMERFVEEYGALMQKGICFPDPRRISTIKAEMKKNLRLKVVSSGKDNIEFTARDADKGLAMLALAKAKGILKEEIICVGDSENDLGMLERAGLSVAMGNAMDSVKAVADHVTDTNDDHGVAKLIQRFLLKGENVHA